MRILMLAQFYPPIIGGEERHVRNLSVALAAQGHDVSVATLWHEGISSRSTANDAHATPGDGVGDQKGRMPEVEIDEGVHVYRIRASMQRISALFSEQERPHAAPFPDPEVLLALRRIVQCVRPHVVHAHNWMVYSFLPLKVWSKAKLVVTLHDYSLVCATKRLMYQSHVCHGPTHKRCIDCAITHYGAIKGIPTTLANMLSSHAERKLVDLFLPVSKAVALGTQLDTYRVPYRVTPNFVADTIDAACDDAHPLLTQLPQEAYLLFVGDIVRDKGIEVLFQAYTSMRHKLPLVVIGRPAADFVVQIPHGVLVLQSWPHAAVMSAWKRCTIAITPSIWPDPCPTVAMEAMAMGRPVVASRIGGLSDIVVDGKTGLLVKPGDAAALQQALDRLVDEPQQREAMGRAGRQHLIHFQTQTVVPTIEKMYQELLHV